MYKRNTIDEVALAFPVERPAAAVHLREVSSSLDTIPVTRRVDGMVDQETTPRDIPLAHEWLDWPCSVVNAHTVFNMKPLEFIRMMQEIALEIGAVKEEDPEMGDFEAGCLGYQLWAKKKLNR